MYVKGGEGGGGGCYSLGALSGIHPEVNSHAGMKSQTTNTKGARIVRSTQNEIGFYFPVRDFVPSGGHTAVINFPLSLSGCFFNLFL